MDARAIIARLRDRQPLTGDELAWFAGGLASGDVTDAQAGAFAMAALLNGLTVPERVDLTLAMRDSGETMKWDLPGPVVDKHSTGGIGDCVSLLLAPMLAACGVYNPMISGRGLGHTGGTLDKLEAIPGLATEVSEDRFRKIVAEVGTAIVSATGDLAPADKRLYAIRDVTSTVESIDLITASILAKKLAAGLDCLILDVKCGSGAFMDTPEKARALAASLVETANGAGCRTAALVTDMNEPLAPAAGNALEVAVCMDILAGPGLNDPDHARLIEVTVALTADLLVMAGTHDGSERARSAALDSLSSGAAAERFGRMVAELGAPGDFVETWRQRLPVAQVSRQVAVDGGGYITAIDTRALGEAVVRLGGGRLKGGDRIDPSVGLDDIAPIGAHLGPGAPLAVVHAADEAAAEAAESSVRGAFTLSETAPDPASLILERLP